MAVTSDKPAPYAPASSVLDIIDRYRNRGLVFPITADVLARAGISDSLIPRTLQALFTLDLFKENGNPSETLEGIRLAPEGEYKKRMEDWLKGAYADVFAFVDPMKDDETRIRDAFRSYQPIGQQGRMVSLFIALCAAAGLTPEKPAASPRPRAAASLRSVATPAQRQAINRVQTKIINNAKKLPSSGLPPALSGLLESLPNASDGWTEADRNKFYTTFGTVLDFCIPIRTTAQMHETGDQE